MIGEIKAYRAICADIARREEKIDAAAYKVADVVQTSAEFPYSLHDIQVKGKVYPPSVEGDRLKLVALRRRKRAVDEFVDGIQDDTIRYAVKRKYIDPCYGERVTWEMVADELDTGISGDAVRNMVARYFKKTNSERSKDEARTKQGQSGDKAVTKCG